MFTLIIIILFISLSLNIAGFILIQNLINKTSVYEKWIVEFRRDVSDTVALMRDIDKQGTFSSFINDKGNFESDDQVGQVFKNLMEVMNDLNEKIQ